jgi:hypothetical protein
MVQICDQLSFLLSGIEQLSIDVPTIKSESTLQVDMDNTQWLELFHLFTAVQTLRISCRLQSVVVSALQGLSGELATEVLPALVKLYLEECYTSGSQDIEPFIIARQHSDHPVAVHR